ncbi:MAG TPA: S8 family serine peptidase, partial [Myxococcota bacterium]|nr:S8 family serine peptidase [Myxococcota bacterium]
MLALLLALAAPAWPGGAAAGAVDAALEARLRALPPESFVPVIVEMAERADPDRAAAAAPAFDRRARGRAVVQALRDTAERTQPGARAALARERERGAARDIRPFWVFNGIAAVATEPAIRRLAARPDVREVRLDAAIPPPVPRPASAAPKSAAPVWNLEVVRAPEVWALDPAYSGAGIVIGSFDTGVDGGHPDLAPRYRGDHAISWFDPYGEHASPYDNHGHGTHTAGTLVGGAASGYRIGVAPGARWIAAKGWSDAGDATESSFHQIFEWFLAPGGSPANAPHVVNSSWGLDPALCFPNFRADVQAFRAAGIVPVFASGNGGPDAGTVLAPGSYAESFTVGATDWDDESAYFSGQGPSPCDGAVKPNVSAPGTFILSTFPGGDYAYLDGTSMAAPHVSGAAALLLSIDPTLTVEEVEAALAAGAVDLGPPGPDHAFGYGRLDALESARLVLGLEKVGIVATIPRAYELGAVPGRFTVSRTGSAEASLTVALAISGDAIPGLDYVALADSVTIPAGAASVTIPVEPIDDTLGELDETVVVALVPSADYVSGPVRATVTIESDEIPPDLVVTALAVPATAGSGDAIAVADTTRNQGSAPSTPS